MRIAASPPSQPEPPARARIPIPFVKDSIFYV
jgi:hypothetical protein